MKKIFALALAIVMIMSLATTAFAEKLDDETTTSTKEIQARISDDGANKAVISVDVTYGDLQFTFISAGTTLWNPETHKFETANDAGTWQVDGDNTIKVVNHSNRDVDVVISAAAEASETGLSFDIASGTGKLANGEVDKVAEAASLTATVTVRGTPDTTSTTYTKVGTITVAITPQATMTNAYTNN